MRLQFVNRCFYPDHAATSQILTDLCIALAARRDEAHVVMRWPQESVAV